MIQQPVCFLSYCHATEVDEDAARRARSLGCQHLLITGSTPLFDPAPDLVAAAKACRRAKVGLIVEVDVRRFPIDHPEVTGRHEDFAIRREGGAGPVDPRRAAPATGEALARLSDPAVAERLADVVVGGLQALVKDGVGGFRLSRSDRLHRDLIAAIAERLGDKVLLLADETPAARQLSELDYVISSQSPYEIAGSVLAQNPPTLFQLDAPAGDPGAVVALKLAATLGAGVIVPASHEDEAIRAAMALPAPAGAGSIRQVSKPGARVFAALRIDGADPRYAGEALLIFGNRTGEPCELPSSDALSRVAAPFLLPLGEAPLAAHEVRAVAARRAPPVAWPKKARPSASPASPRLVIEHVAPSVDNGAFVVKRVVGDRVDVEVTLFGDGHEQLAAELRWRAIDAKGWNTTRMEQLTNDRWSASFILDRLGRHEFVVEGWLDRFGGFQRDFRKKIDAKVAQPVDLMEGRALAEQALGRAKGKLASVLKQLLTALDGASEEEAVTILLSPELRSVMDAADERPHAIQSRSYPVDAERTEASFSSWYELFPRSMSPIPEPGQRPRHGTFADVIDHLPRVRDMGFDTLYFPPIHPIGRKNRKGPNNTLTPGPEDPGSPYATGSEEGGHDAIHPELGTFEDFDRLVAAAHEHGLEIALDFAIQAAPDHPWLKEHPGWFAWRPDGSMKYAENPPKKYQDIVNVDFYGPDAVPGLWEALRNVILLWVSHGVKTFRVDNPHTKPLPFWEWMIGEVRSAHPDVIFLSEAFTRPTMMYRLAKVGFSQSYTYFTWRDNKHELTEYITELTTEAPRDFYRPHFFVNTPDINPHFLQTGGRPAHRIRAVLAATLSGLWGVYSGFELCDATPLGPGKEEYLDSEKYEVRPRDWHAPGNIIDDITMLNRLRRAHPALQTHLGTRFYAAHNDNIIWYGKPSFASDGSMRDMIMVMVNMDPHNAHGCGFEVPLWEFGLDDHAAIAVEDLAHGHRFHWHGKPQHITLSPDEPYRIWRLTRPGEAL